MMFQAPDLDLVISHPGLFEFLQMPPLFTWFLGVAGECLFIVQ